MLRAFRKMFDFTCFSFIDISLEMGTQIPLQTILTNLRPINPCWLQSAICNGLLTVVAWKNVSTKATMRISMSSYPNREENGAHFGLWPKNENFKKCILKVIHKPHFSIPSADIIFIFWCLTLSLNIWEKIIGLLM